MICHILVTKMHAYSNRSKLNSSLAVDNDFSLNLRPEVTVNMAFFILLAVIIIATNLLVPASIYINPRLRCPTYLLILSLSAADLMVGLFLLPVRVIELLSYDWTREFVWCQMSSSLNLFSLSASLLSLLAVTADRFLAISYSLRYRTIITSNRIYVTIAAVWVTAFTVSFLPLFGLWMKPVELYRVHRLCLFGDVMEGTYMALFFVFICAAPTMLITLAYVKIFALARSQERRIASLKVFADMGPTQLPNHKRVSFTRESKAAKTTGKIEEIAGAINNVRVISRATRVSKEEVRKGHARRTRERARMSWIIRGARAGRRIHKAGDFKRFTRVVLARLYLNGKRGC